MVKTIVIGAGVMGASVAYRLAQAGAAVTVLEATRIGGGTSGISFAWTNAHKKPPKPYHDLNVAGMKAHGSMRRRLPSILCRGRAICGCSGGIVSSAATAQSRSTSSARSAVSSRT